MLKLGEDTQYLPELAEGFDWEITLDVSSPSVKVNVVDFQREYVYGEFLPVRDFSTVEETREAILEVAQQISRRQRHWNKEFATMVKQAINSLYPPQDDAGKTLDDVRIIKVGDRLTLDPESVKTHYWRGMGIEPPRDPNEPRPRS